MLFLYIIHRHVVSLSCCIISWSHHRFIKVLPLLPSYSSFKTHRLPFSFPLSVSSSFSFLVKPSSSFYQGPLSLPPSLSFKPPPIFFPSIYKFLVFFHTYYFVLSPSFFFFFFWEYFLFFFLDFLFLILFFYCCSLIDLFLSVIVDNCTVFFTL